MKKITAMLLVLVMSLSLVACGASTPQQDNAGGKNSNGEITFSEIVAVDNDECTIKITGIDPGNMWGYTLKAQLVNKSGDKTYMFSVESAAVNGVQSDPFFAAEVAPGKSSNNDISFNSDTLAENGVGDFTDIELSFRVYDSDNWDADDVAKETIHVYPYGEDKATKFTRTAQPSDNVIVDNDYVTVVVTGYETSSTDSYMVNLFLLNKTDKDVMFSVDDASLNGFMADPFFATLVTAGKCSFKSLDWYGSTLEENGITEVNNIEFTIKAYDNDDWLSDYFMEDTITLNP